MRILPRISASTTATSFCRHAALGCFLLISTVSSAATHHGAAAQPPGLTATALLIIGVVLLVLEIKVVSQGLLGFLGSLLLVAASVIIWRQGASFWGIPVTYVIPIIALVLVLCVCLSVLGVRASREKVVTGYDGFVGDYAVASVALRPSGQVFFQGAYWHAESSSPVLTGEKVRIVAVHKLRLYVEPVAPSSDLPS